MYRKTLGKRILSVILSATMALSSFVGNAGPVYAQNIEMESLVEPTNNPGGDPAPDGILLPLDGGDIVVSDALLGAPTERFTFVLNGKDCVGGTPVEVMYGDPLYLSLKDVADVGAIKFYYSRYQTFMDAEENDAILEIVQGDSDFAKTLDVGRVYYIAFDGIVGEGLDSDNDGNHSFIITQAKLADVNRAGWQSDFVADWDAPVAATNGVVLNAGSVGKYELHLYKGDTEIDLDSQSDALGIVVNADDTTHNFATEIAENGYGTYHYTVKALTSDAQSTNYADAESFTSENVIYRDELLPAFAGTPVFDELTQTISMEAVDDESGVAAFAITTNASLAASDAGWVTISNPGAGVLVGSDVLNHTFNKDDVAGTYYLYIKDAFDNVTVSDTTITLHKLAYINDGNDTGVVDSALFYTTDSHNLKTPVRDGYTFAGWFTDSDCTNAAKATVELTDLVDNAYTVYAKWEFIEVEFVKQPNNGENYTTTYTGTTHTFDAQISNATGEITWQWQKLGLDGATWENASVVGANTNTMSVRNVAESGTYRVVAKVKIGDDESVVPSTAIQVTIEPAELTIKADTLSVNYGGNKPELTYTFDTLLGNDTKDNVTLTVGTIECPAWDAAETEGTLPLAFGEYPIVIEGFDVENYDVTLVNGLLKITSYDVNDENSKVRVELSQYEYTYAMGPDNAPIAYEPTVTVYNGEDLIPTTEYQIRYIANNVAGTASVEVTFSNVNYKGQLIKEFEIKQATFNTEVSMVGWKYGEAAPANMPAIQSNVSGGTVTYHYEDKDHKSLGTTKPVHAGTYYVYAVVAATNDYAEVTTEKVEFVIQPRTVIITAGSMKWEYDSNPHAYETYKITGDGMIVGDDFQSIIITGTITNKGTVPNKVNYHLPDHILATDYDIQTVDGELEITETTLPVPGGIVWSPERSEIGLAEWVPVVKKNLEIEYEVQLYRRNADGTYQAVSDKIHTNKANYDFKSMIYEDAEKAYFQEGVQSVVSYVYSVEAFPIGGDAKDNYKLSEVSDYSKMNHFGTNLVILDGDSHITGVSASRTDSSAPEITDSSFVILQGETVNLVATCNDTHQVGRNVWTVNGTGYYVYANGNSYFNRTYNESYAYAPSVISFAGDYRAYITAHTHDREPVVNAFEAELTDDLDKAIFTIKASDTIQLVGWKLVKGKPDDGKVTDSDWNTEGIINGGKILDTTVEITEPGTYYLFVKDSGNTIAGGWLYDEEEEYNVLRLYQIDFNAGDATAVGSMHSIFKLEDEAITIPAMNYTVAGKTFKNWLTKNNNVLEDQAMYVLNQNDTLKAIWTDEQYSYTVRYHYQDLTEDPDAVKPEDRLVLSYKTDAELEAAGEELETQSFKGGYNEVVDPSLEKYKKLLKEKPGYVLDTDLSKAVTIVNGTNVVDIYYKRNQYTIYYSYLDTAKVNHQAGTQTYYFGQSIKELEKPEEKAGYKFIGWTYESLGVKPSTMPSQDIEATGLYEAQTVKYTIYYYYESLTDGEYYFSGEDTRNALQGEEVTMTTSDVTKTMGFTNSYVVAVTSKEQPKQSTLPAGAKKSATGIASAVPGDELYFVYYRTRNTYNLTLNVWKGDRLVDGKKLYTNTWKLKYGQNISNEEAISYENYGKEEQWKEGAEKLGVDLDGYVVANYVDWSTETRPTSMPYGDVVVSREYVLAIQKPYHINVFQEEADGSYKKWGTLIYTGTLGDRVNIGTGVDCVVDYNTLSSSVAGLEYYQYISHPDEKMSGTVTDPDVEDILQLNIYFERKSFPITVSFYDGNTSNVIHTEKPVQKWGTKYEFDPDQYFDYIADKEAGYPANADASNVNSFRNKGYVVSYETYYWTTAITSKGQANGHYSVKNLDSVEDLEKNYSATVGMNNGTYIRVYYYAPEIDKQYCYNVGYNASGLYKEANQFVPLEWPADDNPDVKYKIRLANKRYIYEASLTVPTEYTRYPGIAYRLGTWTYTGNVNPGFTIKNVTYGGITYQFAVDNAGYMYIPDISNQYYEGNRISLNYATGASKAQDVSNGGYNIAYSMITDFLAEHQQKYGDDSEDPDPNGASTIKIYHSGTSHLCEEDAKAGHSYLSTHNYVYTFYYDNWFTLTYRLVGGNDCAAHQYLYNDLIENVQNGCSHTGVFPERKGYDIVWYSDAGWKNIATDFHIKENTILYGRYEKSIIFNKEFLVYPLAETITVGGVDYSEGLTEAMVLAIQAANDPNYVITSHTDTREFSVLDNEHNSYRKAMCDTVYYYLNGIPVLTKRIRPAVPFSEVEMKVDDVDSPTYNNMRQYEVEGFRFDDTNVNNRLRAYVQYDPISLFAYYIRENSILSKERLLSENDNPTQYVYCYGYPVKLETLGTDETNSKVGYSFAGWKLFDGTKYDEDGNLVELEDVEIKKINDYYQFLMPAHNTIACAVWVPAESDYKLYHYFQDELQNYKTDLVADLMKDTGFAKTFQFAGNDVTGEIYLKTGNVKGAKIQYNSMELYFANATQIDEDTYSLDEADLIAAVTDASFKSETEYEVAGTILNDSNISIYRYVNTGWDYQGEHKAYEKEDKFMAYPNMVYVNYYERSSDYKVEAIAIATDGGDADVTITGTGDCFYGQNVSLHATVAEGYDFIGWYQYSDVYASEGVFSSKYNNTFGDGDGADKLVALSTDETYDIHVEKSYKLVAIIKARETQMPGIIISGKTDYVYGYAYSASNVLSVGVDLSEVDAATYIKGYQWYVKKPKKNESDPEPEYELLTGATAANYIIPVGHNAGEYEYQCKVIVARKDNGRELIAYPETKITVAKADLKVTGYNDIYTYTANDYYMYFAWPSTLSGTWADEYGLCYYYSEKPITVEDYKEKHEQNPSEYGFVDHYYGDDGVRALYKQRDVLVDENGDVTSYKKYIVIVDPNGNYKDTEVLCTLTIQPIAVTLKATSKVFSKIYDGTVDVSGSVIEEGSQKNQIAKGVFYTINGILDAELDTTLLDFDAEFNSEHVKDASAVHLTNIKVVYQDGYTNHNYTFADSYYLNISGHINPFPLSAVWGDEREFVYNGTLQGPSATLAEGNHAPDGDKFTLTITGKQTNVGSYRANVIVEDNPGHYYSSDYTFSTEGIEYKIVKKKILVTPVAKTVEYDGNKHYLDSDVTVTGYPDNDSTKEAYEVAAGDKYTYGLVAENHKITYGVNKGYVNANATDETYNDLQVTNVKIEETTIGADDQPINKAVTGNYEVIYGNGTLKITKKPVIIEGIQASSKVYDGNDHATLVFEDEQGTDLITFNGKLAQDTLSYDKTKIHGHFETEHVGNNKNVYIDFEDGALTGESAENYELDKTTQTVKADITSRGLVVKADAITEVYGESIPFTYSCTGFGEDDQNQTLSGTAIYKLYRFKDEAKTQKEYIDLDKPAVGTYYIEMDISELSNADYTLSWDNVNVEDQKVTITKRPITVAASDAASVSNDAATLLVSKNYDGTVAATQNVQEIADFTPYYVFGGVENNAKSGVVAGDSVSLVIANAQNADFEANYDDADVKDATKVTLKNLAIDNSNYELVTDEFDVKGEINAIALTITAKNFIGDDAIVYGTTTIPYDVTVVGFLEDEEATEKAKITYESTYDSTVEAKRNVTSGTGYYVVTPQYENDNYEITIIPGNIQVNPKEITVTPVVGADLIYGIDIALPSLEPTYSGWVYGESTDKITSDTSVLNSWDSVDCEVTSDNIKSKLPNEYAVNYKEDVLNAMTADNYIFVGDEGSLKIKRQEISVSGITVDGKVYNGLTDVAATNIHLENVILHYHIEGTETDEEPTLEQMAERFKISAAYKDKNAGTGKTVDLTVELIGEFATRYTFDDASQVTATADITPAELTITAKPRTIYFGEALTYDSAHPENYAFAGKEDGTENFVNGETFKDLEPYGLLAYAAYTIDGNHRKYTIGSPAGNYKIEIGGYANLPSWGTPNYNIHFVNNDASVLRIDPATLETPAPVWSATKPGTITWAAIPNVGDDATVDNPDNVKVKVDHYEISLFKTDVATNAASACTVTTHVENSDFNITYVDGQATYEKNYADLIRENGVGIYHVQVRAFASLENNAGYQNVNPSSELGTTAKGLYTSNVTVVFADDSTAGAGTVDPNFVIGPNADVDTYLVIAGESGVGIKATLATTAGKNTGYTVKNCVGAFKTATASETNPVGITVSDGSLADQIYTAKIALANDITSTADRKVVLSLDKSPATLQVQLELINDHAPYKYAEAAAPRFKVTANVEQGDNVTTTGYTYTYQWYARDGKIGQFAAVGDPIVSTEATNTYVLPQDKPVATEYYYAYCTVTAKRNDNAEVKSVNTVRNIGASVDKAKITDAVVINAESGVTSLDWTYGEKRTDFAVSTNPDNAPVHYTYSTALDGTYSDTKPVDAGTYYVKARIEATANYEEFITPAKEFKIIQAKLGVPTNIGMTASTTAPYGLFHWDAVEGPKENAGAADSDMTIAVKYNVKFYYEKDKDGNDRNELLKEVTITDTEYDFTSYVNEPGTYEVDIYALVGNAANVLVRAQNNCANGDVQKAEAKIDVKAKINCDLAGYQKTYDGQPMRLYVEYDIDGHTKYQWLKDNVAVEGANNSYYELTYVEENATYICKISPNGTWAEDDTVFSTPAAAVIVPRALTISSKDATKIYDGTPLTAANAQYDSGLSYSPAEMSGNTGLVKVSDAIYDEVTAITQNASITTAKTDANTTTNTMSGIKITHHDNGVDKVVYDEAVAAVTGNTNNYVITKSEGTLTVTKRAITVTAKDSERTYNGTALNKDAYEITLTNPGDFAEGTAALATDDTAVVVITGSKTNAFGTADQKNEVTSVTITNKDNENVNDCYIITTVDGTLKVNPRSLGDGAAYTDGITVSFTTADPYEETYNGGKHTPVITVKDDLTKVSGTNAEYTLVAGEDKDYTVEYSNNINAGTATVTITGRGNYTGTITKTFVINPLPVELSWNKNTFVYDATNKTVTATVSNLQTNVGDTSGSADGTKDVVTVKTYTDNVKKFVDSYTAVATELEGEDAANYTLTGGSNVSHDWTITPANGQIVITTTKAQLDKTYDDVAISPVTYTKLGTGVVSIEYYKVTEDEDGSMIYTLIATTTGENEVVDADNAEKRNGTGTTDVKLPKDAGTYAVVARVAADNNYAAAASAATQDAYLTFTIAKREVMVTTPSDTKIYDGTALTNTNATTGLVTGNDHSGLVTGHIANVVVGGKQIVAGKSNNTVTSVTIKQSSAEDALDVTENYLIKKTEGILEVTKRAITVTAKNDEFGYNGESHSNAGYEITLTNPSDFAEGTAAIASGDTENVVITGAKTNAYTTDDATNVVTSVTIKNSDDVDVTSSYDITKVDGTLKVNPRSLGDGAAYTDGITVSFTTNDPYSEVYNGGKHTPVITVKDNLTKVSGTNAEYTLVAGEDKDYTVEYSNNINAGTAMVTITGHGNYTGTITKTFVINPLPVELSWDHDSFVYDGQDKTVTATVTNLQTNVGDTTGSADGTKDVVTVATYENNVKRPVGVYTAKALTLTGEDAGNYTVTGGTNVSHTWDISSIAGGIVITTTSEQLTKTYDGATVSPVKYTKYGTGVVTIEYYKVTEDEAGNKNYELLVTTNGEGEVVDADNAEKRNGTGKTDAKLPKDAGTYAVVARAAADNNYGAAASAATQDDYLTFTITKRQVKITAASDERAYNGQALTNSNVTASGIDGVTPSGLVNGQVIVATVIGSQTDFGESENVITEVAIKESNAATALDVTSNYIITTAKGTLKVTKANEVITLTMNSKVYDATPVADPVVTKLGDATPVVTYYDKDKNLIATAPTDAGTYYVKATITGSQNYTDGATDFVEFAIAKREVLVKALSATRKYNGEALTAGYEVLTTAVVPSGLVSGHKEQVQINGSQTDAGSSSNVVGTVVIFDSSAENANDVTKNYEVKTQTGTLTVEQADEVITLTINGKVYDATEITAPNVTKKGDATPVVTYYDKDKQPIIGAPVDAGTYYAKASISGSKNYTDATTDYIEFAITTRPIKLIPDSDEKDYDGQPLTKATFTYEGDGTAESGLVATHVIEATVVGSQTDKGSSYNTIELSTVKIYTAGKAKEVTANYNIDVTAKGTLTVKSIDDDVVITTKSKIYDGKPIEIPSVVAQGNGTVVIKYYDEQKNELGTTAPVNAGTYYAKAFVTDSSNHNDAESGMEVFSIAQREIKITAGSKKEKYTGNAISEASYTIGATQTSPSGLVEGQILTAKTSGSQTEVGKSANIVVENQVVIKESSAANAKDTTANYKLVLIDGELEITKADETISVSVNGKVYDAKPIDEPVVTKKGDGVVSITYYDSTKQNILVTAPVDAGQYYVKAAVKNSTSYVDATTDFVAFEITKREIKVTAKSDEKIYDGNALVNAEFDVSGTDATPSGLVEGQKVLAEITGTQTEAGETKNIVGTVSIKSSGDADAKDVTANYNITKVDGKLLVKKAEELIEVSAQSIIYAGKPYDAFEITKKGDGQVSIKYYDGNGQLLTEAPENVGSYQIKVAIKDSKNYQDAESIMVPFVIKKREVKIVASSKNKVYDGTPLTSSEYTVMETDVTPSGIVSGQDATVKVEGTITDVGTVENLVTDVKITKSNTDSYNASAHWINSMGIEMDQIRQNASGNDTTGNYDIILTPGKLEITKANENISLTAVGKVYDGTPVATPDIQKSGDGVVEILYFDSNKQPLDKAPSMAGEYFAKAKIHDSKNYLDDETDFVAYAITKREIKIVASSGKKEYDGTALVSPAYDVLPTDKNPSGLVAGQVISVTVIGAQTEAGTSANVIDVVQIKESEALDALDVTESYTIIKVDGVLEVIDSGMSGLEDEEDPIPSNPDDTNGGVQTGDSKSLLWYLILCVISGAYVIKEVVFYRKREENE